MGFIHQDRDFVDLLRIVARDQGLSPGLVEKDYWVTHTLWALHPFTSIDKASLLRQADLLTDHELVTLLESVVPKPGG